MLGLSSGPSSGPPPFSATTPLPPPPVDIALASLLFISLSNFTFSQFSLPALYLSESLIISMTDRAVWLRPASSSGFLSVPLPGRGPWLFSTSSHPPSPTPHPPTHPQWSLLPSFFSPPVSPPSAFPRPRGVELRAQAPVSQRVHLPGDGGAVQQQASPLAAQRHPQERDRTVSPPIASFPSAPFHVLSARIPGVIAWLWWKQRA